ncbi:MAG: hypothetical protein GF355_01690 [Candidatus Eisenbacteria bacterium]|nr:hypothetical protein [Candidatus Eisenbacteria bacterium]
MKPYEFREKTCDERIRRPGARPPVTLLLLAAASIAAMIPGLQAQPPVGPVEFLPGDAGSELAVEDQDLVAVAPGGPGYLAVWQDERTVLSGFTQAPYTPLIGNQTDIYAARLDLNGQLVDQSPILVSNLGRNQTRPQVAWNGESWLVVFETERPDWYFFQDIMGVRVSAEGQLLDPDPIPLRLENNNPANDNGDNPSVTGDGSQWLVIWQDQIYDENQIAKVNISGKRVAADGTVLDPDPVVLHQHDSDVFGPVHPHIDWAGDEYLLVYERAGFDDLYGKRIAGDLTPLDANPFLINGSDTHPRVAAGDADFLVVGRSLRAYRVTHSGQVLDPGGLSLQMPAGSQQRGPRVAWDGMTWVAVASAGSNDTYLARVAADGTVTPGVAVDPSADNQFSPSVASSGDGAELVLWSSSQPFQSAGIRGVRVLSDGTTGTTADVSIGWHRQSYVRFAANGAGEMMAVFLSEGGGAARILAQRIDEGGEPLDAEPVVVETFDTALKLQPKIAWNGSVYCIAWAREGSIYARRFDSGAAPVDPDPVLLLADDATGVGIGALGQNFYVAYPYLFSADQQPLKGVPVDGSDLSLIGSPQMIGFDFSFAPRIHALGDRWLLVWERQISHDNTSSSIYGLFVEASGAPGAVFTISGSGQGDFPDLAVSGDSALVVWYDNGEFTDWKIEGRLVAADGSFGGPEFLICDAANHQYHPAAGWDGEQFIAAWSDLRDLLDIEAPRPDIYAARISEQGMVLDPCGFQLTEGPLPEDLPAVTGSGGMAAVAFCKLHGAARPEVQRIGYRIVGIDPSSAETAGGRGPAALLVRPSPSHGPTWIELAGPGAPAPARIQIVTPAGGIVRSLNTSARTYFWDGTGDGGQQVPGGVYFIRVTLEDGRRLDRRVLVVD